MEWTRDEILTVLDNCCGNFTFPILDNGYVHMATTRLSAYRSDVDWHLAIEVFGFSPSAGVPNNSVYHFGSGIVRQQKPENFDTPDAWENYLQHNPNNEIHFIYPIEDGDWVDPETGDTTVPGTSMVIRSKEVAVPSRDECASSGVELEDNSVVYVYELCRAVAASHRDDILASEEELRLLVPAGMELMLRLDKWNHPDVVEAKQKASNSSTMQQIAAVLVSGDSSVYKADEEPNTHWSNWPEGGQL